jgi:hypothetical protein
MISYYKFSLVSLFTKIQELKANPQNPGLCFEIQETLIRRISNVEAIIRRLKNRIEDNKIVFSENRPTRPSKAESIEIKEKTKHFHELIDDYYCILDIFRDVGDAVAFIYIDKWDIKPLAFKESAGYLSGKKGARLERKIFRSLFKLEIIAILNDLTHSLRYSDITVPKNGEFMLLEVKSGKKKRLGKRGKRQSEKTNNVVQYLKEDFTRNLYNKEGDYFRVSQNKTEKNHLEKLNRLIEEAFLKGFCYEEVEKGVFYYVSKIFDENSLSYIVDMCIGKPIIIFPNHIENTAYYPFTLSVRNPFALYDIYNRSLTILIIFGADVIYQAFLSRGLEVEILSDENWALSFN